MKSRIDFSLSFLWTKTYLNIWMDFYKDTTWYWRITHEGNNLLWLKWTKEYNHRLILSLITSKKLQQVQIWISNWKIYSLKASNLNSSSPSNFNLLLRPHHISQPNNNNSQTLPTFPCLNKPLLNNNISLTSPLLQELIINLTKEYKEWEILSIA